LATASFVALDFLFHGLTYAFIRLRQTLGRLAEAQPPRPPSPTPIGI